MWEVLLTSSALILAILAVRALLGKRVPRRLLYALWLLVALRLLVPVSFASSGASLMNPVNEMASGVATAIAQTERELAALEAEQARTQDEPQALDPERYEGAAGETVPETRPQPETNSENEASAVKPPFWLSALRFLKAKNGLALKLVWAFGALTVGGWMLYANLRFACSLRRRAVKIDVVKCRLPLYWCEDIPSPCLVGLFRPAIYITRFSADEREKLNDVVTHELCHYAHGDHIWALVRCVCTALYWFNPLVWAAAKVSKIDCELACDEAVIRKLGDAHRLDYGKTLVRMIGERSGYSDRGLAATTMISDKKGIKERILQIAGKPRRSAVCVALGIVVVLVLSVCAFSGATVSPEPVLPPVPVDPLTGLAGVPENRVGMKPFAFMVNNFYYSWPQRGISTADIIVEMPLEGGVPRMVALYSDVADLAQIGSIRGSRIPMVEAVAHVDPLICEIGNAIGTANRELELGLDVIDGGQYLGYSNSGREDGITCIYIDKERMENYATESCKYFLPPEIYETEKGGDRPSSVPDATFFHFGDTADNAWEQLAVVARFEFMPDGTRTDSELRYDGSSEKYLKSEYGKPQVDEADGKQLAFDNVFVLFAGFTPYENVYYDGGEPRYADIDIPQLRLVDFTHGGAGYYMRGGQMQSITWSKPDAKQGFVFTDANGNELVVGTGTSYIAIADENAAETFTAR